jgi:hypothetical protein
VTSPTRCAARRRSVPSRAPLHRPIGQSDNRGIEHEESK